MEKIKVNMSPNPLDVQTIHASQNDGEARQWEFELHNNGELIDTSDVKEQLVFKAYKGGTEQLLPDNGSTPTTTPILADIQYPDGLRTDQYFTYRETPTTVSNKARIKTIKGNTLVWNQLIGRTGLYTTTKNGVTITITGASDNSITLTAQGTVNLTTEDQNYYSLIPAINIKNGHKYLLSSTSSTFYMYGYAAGTTAIDQQKSIFTSTRDALMGFTIRPITSAFTEGKVINETFYVMFIDLTQMFGAGNEPTTVEEFTSLFPLPYYKYNAGTLLSFNGNGIKTVGKNLLNLNVQAEDVTIAGIRYVHNSDGTISVSGTATGTSTYRIFSSTSASRFSGMYLQGNPINDNNVAMLGAQENGGSWASYGYDYGLGVKLKDIPEGTNVWIFIRIFQGKTVNMTFKPMICFNNNETFEPYTSSTLSLPISTYFPNGMDGINDAYDELTNSGYAKRMERVDLGSITYSRVESQTSGVYFFIGQFNSIPNIKVKSNYDVWNIKTAMYETVSSANIYLGTAQNKTIGGHDGKTVRIRDDSFTDPTEFKNSLSGQYLVYELVTPTETSFTTASLVTENTEIPLSNDDGVLIGKCTEQLSENPGFIDAKIKLSDSDGECYSNKIQLHVERKPS